MVQLPQVEVFRDVATGTVSYLILCPECGECAVLDIGERGNIDSRLAQIISFVRRNGLTLRWLADTRLHDEVGDHRARELQQRLGGRRVGAARRPPPRYDLEVVDGDELPLGAGGLKVLHTPGTTVDSVSYQMAGQVFVGDLLGLDAAARPVLGANDAVARASLSRLLALPPATSVRVGVSCADVVPLSVADLRLAFEDVSALPTGFGSAPS